MDNATPVQSRNQSYLDIIANEKSLNDNYKLILSFIIRNGGSAIFREISAETGIEINIVTARVNELVHDYEILYSDGERKINPVSNKPNILWKINYDKFNLFNLSFHRKLGNERNRKHRETTTNNYHLSTNN